MEVMNIKRKRVMILFIEAAEKMLREGGLASVSIRKVASEVGYNSATLYNYFEIFAVCAGAPATSSTDKASVCGISFGSFA